MSATAIVRSPRDQWLARRRSLITASDVPAILGQDPRRGPLAVFLSKVGEIEAEETEVMARGRDFEDAIGRAYARQTGRPVMPPKDPFEVHVHPDLPWLGFTPDRLTITTSDELMVGASATLAPLQLKMGLGSAKDWGDEPPLGYAIQCQIEIACFDSGWGALAGFIGPGPLKVYDLERHDAFLRKAIPALEDFHRRVQRREPPLADALPGTTDAVKAMWPDEDGTTVPLDGDALALIEEIDAAKVCLAAEKERVDAAHNALRVLMGSATFGGPLPDGSFVTLKTTNRRGFTVPPAQYRTLRRFWPRLRSRR